MAESASLEDKLKTLCLKDVNCYSLAGQNYIGKIVDVYDGDTLTCGFFFNNCPIKVKVRMEGYDSPEMKPLLKIENRDLHIECAHLAKEKLKSLTNNKIITINFNEQDKYGRQLAKLYINNICINDIMISEGYGKPYDGGKKGIFTKENLLNIKSQKK